MTTKQHKKIVITQIKAYKSMIKKINNEIKNCEHNMKIFKKLKSM